MAKAKQIIPVSIVLDQSGSMASMRDEAINGINKYVADLAADTEHSYAISMLLFDTAKLDQRCTRTPAAKVKPLTDRTYVPSAGTPLLDAVAHAIRTAEEGADKVPPLVVILTDGYENSSREMTQETLNALMKEKEALGWTFIYLGVAVEAWKQDGAFAGTSAMSNAYRSSGGQGLTKGLGQTTNSTIMYASARAAGAQGVIDTLTPEEAQQQVQNNTTASPVGTPTPEKPRKPNARGK